MYLRGRSDCRTRVPACAPSSGSYRKGQENDGKVERLEDPLAVYSVSGCDCVFGVEEELEYSTVRRSWIRLGSMMETTKWQAQ